VAAPLAPRVRELLCVAGVALVLTLVFTWPLAARFGSAGRIDSNDGRFSIWNVAWVARALTNQPSEIWNANIFYPSQGALSFSEANLVAGAIAAPVWVLTGNPYSALNFAVVASFVLSAVCMFALVRHLTGTRTTAAFAALLFAFNSYVFAHLPHIQLLMTFGLPLSLLCMHRFVEMPSLRRAGVLGLALGLQALACGYYGLYGGLAVGFGIVWFGAAGRLWSSPRFWCLSAAAAAVAVLVVSPVLPSYLSLQAAGLDRTLLEATQFSVRWRAYLASGFLVYRWILPLIGHWREVLFPGVLSIAFAAMAVADTVRAHDGEGSPARAHVWFYVGLGVLAAWASLGPDAGLYRVLYRVVPGMSFLRAPSRFGLLVILACAVLASFGLLTAERRWPARRRFTYLALLTVFALARSTVGPLALRDAPKASSLYAELRRLPRGPVAEFPFYTGARLPRQTEYMLSSTQHWQPLINGFSDYLPPDFERDLPSLDHFPEPDALKVLRRRDVRYVVVHWVNYGSGRDALRARVESMAALRKIGDEPGASLFELEPPATSQR
jgi:hypothetical protein